MDSRWTSGENKEFKDYLLNSSGVFDKMRSILDKMVKRQKRDDYKEAGWPYLRAYDDGYNAALKEVKDLITFKEG